jgi:hypothetical protein
MSVGAGVPGGVGVVVGLVIAEPAALDDPPAGLSLWLLPHAAAASALIAPIATAFVHTRRCYCIMR